MSYVYTRQMEVERLKGVCNLCGATYYGAVPGGEGVGGCSKKTEGGRCGGKCSLFMEKIMVDDPSSRKAVCSSEGCQNQSQDQFVGGIYAGHYCDEHWAQKGYNRDWKYDYLDAGEYLDENDY